MYFTASLKTEGPGRHVTLKVWRQGIDAFLTSKRGSLLSARQKDCEKSAILRCGSSQTVSGENHISRQAPLSLLKKSTAGPFWQWNKHKFRKKFNSKADRLGSEGLVARSTSNTVKSTKTKSFCTCAFDRLFHEAHILPWSPKLYQPQHVLSLAPSHEEETFL
jgi:hypothetical protein